MNTSIRHYARYTRLFAAGAAASLVLAGCAAAPIGPQGSVEARSKLTQLQSDPNLASRAPVEIREAEAAVRVAEEPVAKDVALGEHRVYIADRKIEIAKARASTRYAEDQRAALSREREQARLDARTREADKAHAQTAMARRDTNAARASAADAAADAANEAEELQRQIDVLQAEATDRGIVLTLGHVLFATGQADLKPAATTSLNKLVAFLDQYPDRSVAIEGHTDNVGTDELNQRLSQHRADSVKSYLMQQGIDSRRLTASGMGKLHPVAENESESGRQQNRRVEVIIEYPPSAIPTARTN